MTVRQWLTEAEGRIPGPDAAVEARWMLEDALRATPTELRLALGRPIPDRSLSRLADWLERRASGVPLQYVLGYAPFMGYDFRVDERVLIPRQDTELLCELAIGHIKQTEVGTEALDLCTGSGAVAIAIALKCPDARVTATDLSADALALARENARRLDARVEFACGDFFEPVRGRRFDVIACNPPYLTGADMDALQPEVRFEPASALYGGEDGLAFYRRAAAEVRGFLKPGGRALFEVGAGQARAVCELLGGHCEIYRDLNQIERVVALNAEG